jgi:hypothetical protein
MARNEDSRSTKSITIVFVRHGGQLGGGIRIEVVGLVSLFRYTFLGYWDYGVRCSSRGDNGWVELDGDQTSPS